MIAINQENLNLRDLNKLLLVSSIFLFLVIASYSALACGTTTTTTIPTTTTTIPPTTTTTPTTTTVPETTTTTTIPETTTTTTTIPEETTTTTTTTLPEETTTTTTTPPETPTGPSGSGPSETGRFDTNFYSSEKVCVVNGVCDPWETAEMCPSDCGNVTTTTQGGTPATTIPSGYVCGNGICKAGEDFTNCPEDCIAVSPVTTTTTAPKSLFGLITGMFTGFKKSSLYYLIALLALIAIVEAVIRYVILPRTVPK